MTERPNDALREANQNREDIRRQLATRQPEGPSDAELSAVVADAIQAWKTARELPYLSPSACKQLNALIVAGLRPVIEGVALRAHEAGRKEQREDDRYGDRS